MSHKHKASTGILPAHRQDSDLSLTPWTAFFGLVGRFYEVPSLVPTPMTHIPLDGTAHCVQMVATDVLPWSATWGQGPGAHRGAPRSAGSHRAKVQRKGDGRTDYLKETPAKQSAPGHVRSRLKAKEKKKMPLSFKQMCFVNWS